jgi:hypothetical protein
VSNTICELIDHVFPAESEKLIFNILAQSLPDKVIGK